MSLVFKCTLWPVYISLRQKNWRSDVLMQNIAGSFLCSLAVMEGVQKGEDILPGDHQLFDETVNLLDTCSKQSPCKAEFAVMLAALRAAKVAATRQDLALVLRAYDTAIDAAAANELRFLEATMCESAALYILEHVAGSGRAARGYLIQSYQVRSLSQSTWILF
jgi:hypothetical protein